MKIENYLLVSLGLIIFMTVLIQLFLINPVLKKELDEMLNDAINMEMVRRLKSSSIHHQVSVFKSSTAVPKKVGIHIITDTENEFIPYGDSVRQENVVFNHNLLLQSGLRKFSPLDVVKIDKILNSILKDKGVSAKTSVRYLDKQDNCQYFSNRGYWFEIRSSVIEVGIKKEMEVQAFILPSVGWMLKVLPCSVKVSYLLVVVLSFVFLFYFYWTKRRDKVALIPNILNEACKSTFWKLDYTNSTDNVDEIILKEIPVYIEKKIRKLNNGDYQVGSFHVDIFRKYLMKDNYCRYIGKRKEYILLLAFLKAKDHCLPAAKVADILEIKNYKFNNQLNAAVTRLRTVLKKDPDIEIILKNEKYTLILNRNTFE